MNRSTIAGLSTFCAILTVACAAANVSDYPVARRDAQVDDYFGEKVPDPYRWMEDVDSPETREWIAAERSHTAQALDAIPERAGIRSRLTQLWNYPKYGLPEKRGGLLFYTMNDGLQDQAVLYVADGPAQPRVLIDPNLLSREGTVALATISPSDDGRLLAYGLAEAGSDWHEIHVLDVATGRNLPDVTRWVKFSGPSWTRDGKGFFYSRYPEVAKGDKLFGRLTGEQMYYHVLGTPQAADRLIFEIKEHPEWRFGGSVTDDGRYLVISYRPSSSVHDAICYADLSDPLSPRLDAPIVHLLDKLDARYSVLGNVGSVFYVETFLGAPRGKVVAIDTANPAAPWGTPVPEGPESISLSALVGGKLVVSTLHDVKSRLAVHPLDGSPGREIELPGIVSVGGVRGTGGDPELFYDYSSYLSPPVVMGCNVDTGAQAVFRQPGTAFDPSRYETTQVFCTSRDGTRVPLFVTARKGLKLDGSTPAWLYGYGGFNIASLPEYSPAHAVWLEMGGIFASANMRGGSEYGEAWHLAGTKERKQNVFDDFIAAADFLVGAHYTSRDRLVIEGRSNGGLLVGAVLNERPDLCAVALPTVGVMDMLRYHTFTIAASWASDYGTSEDPEGFKYLRAYSPVHNVRSGARYPPVLVMTGDHDDRVHPSHSFKYAAAMQHEAALVAGSGPILIRIGHNAGHGGSTGTSPASKTIDEWADKMGFVVHYLPPGTLEVPRAP
jgi:prolyl oligopeptidase